MLQAPAWECETKPTRIWIDSQLPVDTQETVNCWELHWTDPETQTVPLEDMPNFRLLHLCCLLYIKNSIPGPMYLHGPFQRKHFCDEVMA
ncbi:unnamed protein product [Caretta caretta]